MQKSWQNPRTMFKAVLSWRLAQNDQVLEDP